MIFKISVHSMRFITLFVLSFYVSSIYTKQCDCEHNEEICYHPTDYNNEDCYCVNRLKVSDDTDCKLGILDPNCIAKNYTFFKCNEGKCLPIKLRCDKYDDCLDGSDEMDCNYQSCNDNQFMCEPGKCISKTWVCDGQTDCTNGKDELNCDSNIKCDDKSMLCSSTNRCIPKTWTCDGYFDCDDGQDESYNLCGHKTCSDNEFTCNINKNITKQCIPIKWRCDGYVDCSIGSDDELGCESIPKLCDENEFSCNDGNCIPKNKVCDKTMDCLKGDDELHCSKDVQCSSNEFFCSKANICILDVFKCDGKINCPDGDDSDEFDCTSDDFKNKTCDERTEFDCNGKLKGLSNYSPSCINIKYICDSKVHCANGLDENKTVCQDSETCTYKKGDCEYGCYVTATGKKCLCPPGFKLSKNGKSCEDIDECKIWGSCSHPDLCINNKGSYYCRCINGYMRDENPHQCKAIDSPWLLFVSHHDIEAMRHPNEIITMVNYTRRALGISYGYNDKKLFWSEGDAKTINSITIDKNMNELSRECLVKDNLGLVEGIAYDWVSKNLYWTDNRLHVIEVINVENKYRKVIFDTNLNEIRAIVVDPRNGKIYWTDWGKNPRIEEAGMDGSNRKIFVSGSRVKWPNGLAIDFVTDTLFWVDAGLHSLNRISLHNPKDEAFVMIDYSFLRRPYGLTVFEDFLYWTEWGSKGIYKVNKFTGENIITLSPKKHKTFTDVEMYHELRQPNVSYHPCDIIKNGGCSHLCLSKPKLSSSEQLKHTCACPLKYKLKSDGKTCVIQSAGNVPVVHEIDEPYPSASIYTSNKGINKVAGIVVACVILVLILSGVAGYFVHRSYKKRVSIVFKFDNPIYKQTTSTTDEFLLKSATGDGLTSHANEYKKMANGDCSNHSLA